jgi:crotonobetainyl-CoA:carnitine CoA-transferase CaiB-like acyl-CoA transferase
MFPKILRELEEAPGRQGARILPGVGCFETSDGRWITITAVENHIFRDLANAIGKPELADDPANASYASRKANAGRINDAIRACIASQDYETCIAGLRDHDVCWAPVNAAVDVLHDSQVQALGIVHQEPSPHADMPLFGAPTVRRLRAPELDEDGAFVRANGWVGLKERLQGR